VGERKAFDSLGSCSSVTLQVIAWLNIIYNDYNRLGYTLNFFLSNLSLSHQNRQSVFLVI